MVVVGQAWIRLEHWAFFHYSRATLLGKSNDMKRIIQFLAMAALSLTFVGCSPSADKSDGSSQGDKDSGAENKGIIAYSPLTLSNPFFKVIGDHIKSEAEKNGYETLMVDPDMDVKKQSDQMDDFISRGVTSIILVPCDRLSIGPAVKAANDKGIPVFTVDAKCAAVPPWKKSWTWVISLCATSSWPRKTQGLRRSIPLGCVTA